MTAAVHATGQHETVEQMIRYAANRYDEMGVTFPASKLSRLIRSAFRNGGAESARRAVDSYLENGPIDGTPLWYADPVGTRAAHVLGNRVNGKWTGCGNSECRTCTPAPARPREASKRERDHGNTALLAALVVAANGGHMTDHKENGPGTNRAANIQVAEARTTPIVTGGGRND